MLTEFIEAEDAFYIPTVLGGFRTLVSLAAVADCTYYYPNAPGGYSTKSKATGL